MDFQINRMLAADVPQQLDIEPIIKTEGGVILPMQDSDYFKFQAHSKHGIAPAMKSGLDYQFYTVEQRGKREAKAGLDDGSLLHCLLLERSEFEKRYFVGANHDEVHSQNPLYFQATDDLKKFVTNHNRTHSELVKAVKELVKQHNDEIKTGANAEKATDYDKLPQSAKTAQPSPAAMKKIANALKAQLATPIDVSADKDTVTQQVRQLFRIFDHDIRNVLGATFSDLEKASLENKVNLLNKMRPSLIDAFDSKPLDTLIAVAPLSLVEDNLTKAAKDKAVKEFNAQQKGNSELMKICDRQSVVDLVDALKKEGHANSLKDLPNFDKKFFSKIITVGGKKSDKEVYSIREVLEDIKQKLGGAPVLRSTLEEEETLAATHNNQTLISAKQYEHANRIIEATLADPIAGRILKDASNHYEVAMFWNEIVEHKSLSLLPDAGEMAYQDDPNKRLVLCKAKLDLVNFSKNCIGDVKFVSSAEFDALQRDSGKWGYHHQDAMYRRGFNKVMSMLPDGAEELVSFPFIFIEKDAAKLGDDEVKPIRIYVDWYKPHHIERSNRMIDASLIQIERWVSTGQYDGLGKSRQMDVPIYQVRAEEAWLSRTEAELDKSVEETTETKAQQTSAANEHSISQVSEAMPDFNSLKRAG